MADEDDRDETNSLASTVDSTDYDAIFDVESIMGEIVRREDGITLWLVKWENYPLHEASWEPGENLEDSPEAMSKWLNLKTKIQNGEEVDRVQDWADANIISLEAKWERHCQRNRLRKERGLHTTEWPASLQEQISQIKQWLSDNDNNNRAEVSSDEDIVFGRLDDPTSWKQTETKDKTSTAVPPSRSMHDSTSQKALLEARKGGVSPSPIKHSQAAQHAKAGVAKEPPPRGGPASSGDAARHRQRSDLISEGQGHISTATQVHMARSLAPAGDKQPERSRNVATKSRPTPAFSNVFVGGKTRKQRTKSNAASGQGGEGRFLILRNQNLLNKHSRNKENDAPRSLPKHLRSLNSQDPVPMRNDRPVEGPSNVSTDVPTSAQTPTETDRQTFIEGEMPVPPKPGISRQSSLKPVRTIESPVAEAPNPQQLLKRKKSVRFGETPAAGIGTSEPSLFVQDDGPETGKPLPVPQNQGNHPKPTPSKNLPKLCLLGPDASKTVTLLFHNVPRPEEVWATTFEHQESLTFSHTCRADDFIRQFVNHMQCVQKASGIVSAPAHNSLIDTVTDRLKLASMGIWCQEENYSLLLYPFKSEDWEAADKMRTGGHDGALAYIIFEQAGFPRKELMHDSNVSIYDQSYVGQNLEAFLNLDAGNRIFLTEHSKTVEKNEKHHVFLAFPPGAIEQAKLMTQWIKLASKVECVVLDSNHTSSDWETFVRRGRGALVIHEDALRTIRSFPEMFEVLKRSTQGHVAVCMLDRALASSISATMWAKKTPRLGNIGLRKLASSGAVFMLTPSFIVSAPKDCRRFCEWFWDYYTSENTTARRKLAVPAGILEWMTELVLVKVDRRECSSSDEECWERCIIILGKLLRHCCQNDELGGFDDIEPLFTAPEKIDASDEQSLVNWFGIWTVSKLDQYCSFYVLGSAFPSDERPTIHLIPPRWEKGTVSSPGEELHTLRGDSSKGPTQYKPAHPKALQLISVDSAPLLRTFLQDRHREVMRSHNPMYLYFKPVSYEDDDMAFHHGDSRHEASTYRKWFASFYDLNNLKRYFGTPTIKHTLTGLFYTPEVGDGALTENLGKSVLHPWIAMFRPCSPSQAPWTRTELFIWDQRYRGKFRGGQDLWESDLCPVHRTFIRHVGLHNNEKNGQFTLSTVWVGGWDDDMSPYDHLLDITLDRLSMFAIDLGRWVPDSQIDIAQRGWTIIKPDSDRPEPMAVDSDPLRNAVSIKTVGPEVGDDEEDEWDPDTKMVFHFPRGYSVKENGLLCRNNFHHTSQNPTIDRVGRFAYKYAPTRMWYGQQARQGRQFEHVKVDTWKKVFEELGIE